MNDTKEARIAALETQCANARMTLRTLIALLTELNILREADIETLCASVAHRRRDRVDAPLHGEGDEHMPPLRKAG